MAMDATMVSTSLKNKNDIIQVIETPSPLRERFKNLDITVQTYKHQPVFKVGEGKEIKEYLSGGHTKNLFLKDKKSQIWLVVALENTIIDLKWLKKRISSAHLSFGKPELLEETLGVVPGSVTPFALINDTENKTNIILDKDMIEHDILNFHPLINDKTTAIQSSDLIKFIQSCGHKPHIVDFNEQ